MKQRAITIMICISSLLLLVAAAAPGAGDESDVAVIVNPENPADSITSVELRKIFAGEKRSWNSNLPVFLVVRAPQAREREVLLERILKMTESEYKQYWIKKVYSGEVQREPLTLLSNGMQLEAIRAEKGGIALINLRDVREGVKVIKIDGRMPGTPGYPLH
ncbi:MAG TPA: substrate-binding domain-containing protein [Candidatus Angelobacter sp.]|nr:substrate-binding domain-containing protein [Candidatus Angelobacter sp.]